MKIKEICLHYFEKNRFLLFIVNNFNKVVKFINNIFII